MIEATPVNASPAAHKNTQKACFKLFVGNLAHSTTDEGLRAFFNPVQLHILSVQVVFYGKRPAGYGFVALSGAEAAQMAINFLNTKKIDGRAVVVEIAKSADQKDKENKERGSKRRQRRRGSRDVPGRVSKAEAAVDAKTEEGPAAAKDEDAGAKKKGKKDPSKPKAINGNVYKMAPHHHKSAAPRPSQSAGEDPAREPSKTTLFVANLGSRIKDEGLRDLFTEVGISVVSARIVRRNSGIPKRSKGYGFVKVGGEEEQKRAIGLLNGKKVGRRNIAVEVAVNPLLEETKATNVDAVPAAREQA